MTVTVRYWAAAAAAAGVDSEELDGATVAEVLAEATSRHPDLERVLQVAAVLMEGTPARPDADVRAGGTLEILPPFAGG